MGYLNEHKQDISICTTGAIALVAIAAIVSHQRLNSTFKLAEITGELRYGCNVPKTIAKDAARLNNASIKKQPFAKNFTRHDRRIFRTNIQDSCDNIRLFQSTMEGKKPACILAGIDGDLHFLDKGDFDSAIEFAHTQFKTWGKRSKIMNTYMFNKNEVLKIIEKNKEIYTKRLGMAKDCKSEEIYERLKHLFSVEKHECGAFSDIEGLTLGFPKHNTMIFQLENTGDLFKLRKNPQEYKKQILDVLHSERSPYKDLSHHEVESLERTINSITDIGGFHNIMYDFIKFADEPAEFERIKKTTQQYLGTLSKINYTC